VAGFCRPGILPIFEQVYQNMGVDGFGQAAAVGVDGLVDAPVWSLSDADLVAALDAAYAAQVRMAAVTARLAREVDARGLAVAEHATSTAAWLRERWRVSRHTARQVLTLGAALDRSPLLDKTVGAGVINPDQALVIDAALRQLPGEVGGQVTAEAEAALVAYAEAFEPAVLRGLGERILTHVAPQIAERLEQQALERQAERAHQRRELRLADTGDGLVRLSGWLDQVGAATVTAALDPLCTPAGGEDLRTAAQRRADALVDVCALALRTTELPTNGGDRPQVVVTIPFDTLHHGVGTATLDTGAVLTPAQARQWACDAGLIPAVLDGAGQVLNLGRSRRLVTGALRRALVLRDRGCAFPGCDRPPRWCDAHHLTPWAQGGTTDLANTVLLCGHHHRTIHHTLWQAHIAPDGQPEFIPAPCRPPATPPPQPPPPTTPTQTADPTQTATLSEQPP
jgi:hypothetical protein